MYDITYAGGFKEGDFVEFDSWLPAEYGMVTWRGIVENEEEYPWSLQDSNDYVPLISTRRMSGGYEAESLKIVDYIPAESIEESQADWLANVCPRCECKRKLEDDYLCEDCRLGK